MRVTIEIDEKSGAAATTDSGSTGGGASAPASGASPDVYLPSPPADVLDLAASTGAINGGPAPNASTSTDSAPHPFHSHGGAMSEAAHAAAISGGAAPQS